MKKKNEISIFDVQGKIILEKTFPAGLNKITIDNPGFYYVKINNHFSSLIIK